MALFKLAWYSMFMLNGDSEKIQALVDVLKSDEIKDFINEKYDGAVIPFDDSTDAE